ncbi:alcohol dehydrogenase [Agrobacterium sp. P15N1-A]|uniref:alcohol dehydrogenase n=1 Tax=Agrobacterium sp. P15N1-A TaxID=3342820 RepID=UPI0037D736A7
MKSTYKVAQVSVSRKLEIVERATPSPGPDEVLISIEACGICGADAGDIDRADPALQPPRVPGHEVVGRIVALGANTPNLWKIGQRVGVGRLGGHCNDCDQCRRGHFNLCRNQQVLGVSRDGGYAEMLTARSTGLVSIPDDLSSEEAAPILCAGIATFNALKKCGAEAGDTVAILGIGGLGHMAVQYARRMGFRVVAVGRGADIADLSIELGAHRYIDSNVENTVEVLQTLGGAKAVLTTIGNADAVAEIMPALAPEGRLVVLGVAKDPLSVSTGFLVGGERGVMGSITGSPFENERTLDFSVLSGVRPMIETMPLERAQEAVERMRSGNVKFRMVLTMGGNADAHQ